MEEFGCTSDSLQYYPGSNGHRYVANWFLDLITDPQGNQVHIAYQDDISTFNSITYPRDVEMQSITYDSVNCHSATTACTGGNWQPQYQISMPGYHTEAYALTNTPANCNTQLNARCDNAQDLSGSGGLHSPLIEASYVLSDINVQTRTCVTTCNWATLRDYQLRYEQTGPTQHTDSATGLQESTGGFLDLTSIQEVGNDGSTTLPATTFTYASQYEYYEDSTFKPNGGCGISWNAGDINTGNQCVLWSTSYEGNSRYMTTTQNGQGREQDFGWYLARNNTHGATAPTDPFYCTNHQTSTAPCDLADDQNWSRVVLTSRQDKVQTASKSGAGGTVTTNTITQQWQYSYLLTNLTAQECLDCTVGMYWGNQNDGDYMDYYNGKYMGFGQASVSNPDGSITTHYFYSTEGYGVYDTGQVGTYCPSNLPPYNTACHNSKYADPNNALHGHEKEIDQTDTNGTTPLRQVKYTYLTTCPGGLIGATTPAWTAWGNWDGNLVSELDHNNPVMACDIEVSQVDSYLQDGSTNTNLPHATAVLTYDQYGHVKSETDTTNEGGATGSPTSVLKTQDYIYNDSVAVNATGTTGLYLVDFLADTNVYDGAQTQRASCTITQYDGQPYATGQSSGLTAGLVTEQSSYTSCGTSANGWATGTQLQTSTRYDSTGYGNPIATLDADANGGVYGHTGCNFNGVSGGITGSFTTCQLFDTTYQANPASATNDVNYTTTATYNPAVNNALWPTNSTDPNSQTTGYQYDALGRMTSLTLPGITSGPASQAMAYAFWCNGTVNTPCVEQDSTQRLDSGTTVTSRVFYDGAGNQVETRTAAPGGQDVVQYTQYDQRGWLVAQSVPYFVTAYTGAAGSAAYSVPDISQTVTSYTYDGLGRVTSITEPISTSTTTHLNYQMDCGYNSDGACYNGVHTRDANGNLKVSFTDAWGRKIYDETFQTSGNTDTPYSTVKYTEDLLGRVVAITHENGTSQTTYTYNAANWLTAESDPDLGSYTFTYDPNGVLTSVADGRGAAGTVYLCYDGLNRITKKLAINNCSSGTTLAGYQYDQGTNGKGHLTYEDFHSGTTATPISGHYNYGFDSWGRETSWSLAIDGGATYPFTFGYNDANQPTSITYPTGDTLSTSYIQGWLAGVSGTIGGNATTLLNGISYTGLGGASGKPTGAQVGGGTYTWSLGYDGDARLNALTVTQGSNQPYQQTRTFDQVGNVKTVYTALPGGTNDNQAFCYDSLNRLTWAGDTGTPGCGGSAITGTTLPTANQYQQTISYDNLNRLTSGPGGTGYTYGTTPLDAVTSTAGGYSAAYDAAGQETCRATSSAQTCAGGTPTGQPMTYDQLRHLTSWANAATGATSSAVYGSNGEGERVATVATASGTTTTTIYAGPYEEVSTTGGTSTTTTYYPAGPVTGVKVGATLSYLVNDALGSVTATLSTTGTLTAAQLFAPYGGSHYSTGTMPTSYGFTGQRSDGSGLQYFHARYYDPAVGQFTSADPVQGVNRYAYVGGNPETATDPTGNIASPIVGGVHDCGQCQLETPVVATPTSTGTGCTGCKTATAGQTTETQTSAVPGCDGTSDQCTTWGNTKSGSADDLLNQTNLWWAGAGLFETVMEIIQIVREWKSDPIAAVIDLLGALGDILTTSTFLLDFIEGNNPGTNLSGIRLVLATIGTWVNWISVPLKFFKRAPGFLLGLAKEGVRDALKIVFSLNPGGVIWGITSAILSMAFRELDNLQAIGIHIFQAHIDDLQAQAARIQSETINEFCKSNPSKCPGFMSTP